MDIAIGRGKLAPGGILIRTIEQLSNNKVICGPCLVVDHILKLTGSATINILVENNMKDDISVFGDKTNQLSLYPTEESRDETIIHTGRVGLYMTKKSCKIEDQAEYVFRNYRSVAEPTKVSKGRHLMALALIHAGDSNQSISKKTGIKDAVIKRYREAYTDGLKSGRTFDDFSVYAKRINDNLAGVCFGSIIAIQTKDTTKEEKVEEEKEEEDEEEEEEITKDEEMKEADKVENSDENEEIEFSEDERLVEVDACCMIGYIKNSISEAVDDKSSTKQTTVTLYPFPYPFTKALFGEVLDKKKPKKTDLSLEYKLTFEDLIPILGKNWDNGKTFKFSGKTLTLTVFPSVVEGKVEISFKKQKK